MKSQPSAISSPPVKQWPVTRAIVAWGIIEQPHELPRFDAKLSRRIAAEVRGRRRLQIHAGGEGLPSPAMISTRASKAATSSATPSASLISRGEKALRLSGRAKVSRATAPSRENRTHVRASAGISHTKSCGCHLTKYANSPLERQRSGAILSMKHSSITQGGPRGPCGRGTGECCSCQRWTSVCAQVSRPRRRRASRAAACGCHRRSGTRPPAGRPG